MRAHTNEQRCYRSNSISDNGVAQQIKTSLSAGWSSGFGEYFTLPLIRPVWHV